MKCAAHRHGRLHAMPYTPLHVSQNVNDHLLRAENKPTTSSAYKRRKAINRAGVQSGREIESEKE